MTVKIIHKNSSVEFKNATADQLEYGELALNYNESGPYLQCKSADNEIVQLGGVYIDTSAPANPIPGKWWLNDNTLSLWDGTRWVAVALPGGEEPDEVFDGQLTIKDQDGITLGTFTANQELDTEITIDTSSFSGDYDDLDNKPTIGDGKITIQESDGNDVGEFTLNQVGNETITLPAGASFSGSYDDLTDKPTIGDGKLTLSDADGDELGSFTANQVGVTDITLPVGFSGDYDDLTNKPIIGNGAIQINGGDGITASGDNATANQAGATTRTLKVDTTWLGSWIDTNKPAPTVGNAKIIVKQDGSEKGSFTTNQSGSDVTINLDAGSSGGGFEQSDADKLYVSLTKNEEVKGEKTFTDVTRVNNKLRAGGTDSGQFIETFVENVGSGFFKVLQANGDGPMDLRDSTEWASMKFRNLGGPGGHLALQPKANGERCIGVNLSPKITKNGPREPVDCKDYRALQVSIGFDNQRGSKRLEEIYHIHLNCNNGGGGRQGFSADNMYGIYIPDWEGRQGDFGSIRGILSRVTKGGAWFLKHEGTAPFGSDNSGSNLSLKSGYTNSPAGTRRKMVVNQDGWCGSDTLREAELTRNDAVEESVLAAIDTTVSLAPRVVSQVGDEQGGVAIGESTGAETYAPQSDQIRLLPSAVAAIHPLLATYSWPTKEIEYAAAKEATAEYSGEPAQYMDVFDFEQPPIADGVDYDAVTTLLVGVVKRLRSELDEARDRIAALEAGEVSDNATDAALLTLISDMAARITALENP